MPMIDRVLLMSSTVEAAAYTAGSVAGFEDGGSVLTCLPAFSAVGSWSPAVMVPSATDSCTGPKPYTVTRPLTGVSSPAMPMTFADGGADGATGPTVPQPGTSSTSPPTHATEQVRVSCLPVR